MALALFNKKQNQYPVVSNSNTKPVFALDIGSRTIRLVSGLVDKDNFLISVTGYLDTKSRGVKTGTVADPDLLAQTIAELIMNFQQTYGVEIKKIYTNVCGCYVLCEDSEGKRNVQGGQITVNDRNTTISDAISGLNRIHLSEYSIIHIIPQGYRTDVNTNLTNPIGIYASKLQSHVHVIACNKTYLKNVDMIVRKVSNSIESTSLVFDANAAASLVLKESDRDLGCVLVDLGASTTTVSVFSEKYQRFSFGLPEGADYITKRIAADFGIDMRAAEYIKLNYGQANPCVIDPAIANDDVMTVIREHDPSAPVITRIALANSILSSLKEVFNGIFLNLDKWARENKTYKMEAGVILVGGGAQLNGIAPLLELFIELLNKASVYNSVKVAPKVRLGWPIGVSTFENTFKDASFLNAPCNAVALGILRASVMENPEIYRKTDKGSASGSSWLTNAWNYVKREWN